MPNGTNTPVSHIILYELSDCICIDKQMGHYELITACFILKISSKKCTFLRFTHQNLLTPPPPIVHTCCEIFLLFIFGGFPKVLQMSQIILFEFLHYLIQGF